MKKLFLVAVVAVLGLASVGCTSDDNSSSNFDTAIQGVWKESRTLYLGKNDKVIDEDEAYDEGCGLDELEFKDKTLISRSFFLDGTDCEKEEYTTTYSIKGDMIYANKTGESAKIIELTATKLVILGEFINDDDIPVVGEFRKASSYEDIEKVHVVYLRK
ncbi:lipocalin-like domain-containing protein [Myroides odoratus]|nr:lipocalin family protein [Myroides odoratus]WQD56013.1 lipocalin family protein [Myroides odoratus]